MSLSKGITRVNGKNAKEWKEIGIAAPKSHSVTDRFSTHMIKTDMPFSPRELIEPRASYGKPPVASNPIITLFLRYVTTKFQMNS